MSKLIIIIGVLILLLTGNSNGQVYHGFPTIDGYWKVQYGYVSCVDIHGVSDICSEYQYIVTGDTLINTELYRKISLSGQDRNPIDETWTYWNTGYHGCYRNDLAHKKVFYVPKDSINEILLYDFNINLNDTLPETFVYNQSEFSIIIVDNIDSVLVNNIYLKRYHLDNAGFGQKYLIEGIGSTLGLLSPITPFFEQHYDLLCFKNNQDELYYFENDSTDCHLITDIKDEYFLMNNIHLFPNPAHNRFTVENKLNRSILIEVYDPIGQRVKVTKGQNSMTTINISDLRIGIYLVKISSEGIQIKTEKLIKE
jgi:hypothetical protein